MKYKNHIQVHEHKKLALGNGFKARHRNALLKLNELHSFNYLEANANGVTFKNYVGIIQIDDLVIEILPKIDMVSSSEINWRDVLLDMLKVVKKLKVHQNDPAAVKKRNSNLLEIYLDLFLTEIDKLQKRGLIKRYRLETKTSLALKGKLEMAGHIKQSLVYKERFYTTHQVYDYHHMLHVIISKCLSIVIDLTGHSYLAGKARRIMMAFPEINHAKFTTQMFDKLRYDKKTKHYKNALDIARIIIENYSPSIKSGNTKMISLLFNMNSLWEQYVYEMLRRGQEKGKYKVSKPSRSMFVEGPYTLQPDIVLEFDCLEGQSKDQQKRIIIDTKWKVPHKSKASSSDLRQIYAYNRYWKANQGVLLYPGSQEDSSWMLYADEDSENKYYCKLAYLDVLDGDGLLNKGLNITKEIF